MVIALPKKEEQRQCPNYCTIILISHPSKVMVKVTHNRLTRMAERLLAQEHAGFKAGRSAVEQIFNILILIENTFSTVKICTITLLTSKVFDSLARGAVAREAEIQH